MLRRLAVSVIAAAALSVAACGDDDDGGDSVSVGDYANDVCTAFTDWANSLRERQGELQEGLGGDASAEQGKAALRTFFEDAVQASDDLEQNIEAAGVPDTDNGQEAADALQGAAEEARNELADSRDDVEGLSTESPKAFADAAAKFGAEATAALSAVGSNLQQIDAPELDKAFDEEPACQT